MADKGPLPSRRNQRWDYAKREVGETYGGLEYSYALAGPGGAHFHFWLPADGTEQDLKRALRDCRSQRDVVTWSWDYLP